MQLTKISDLVKHTDGVWATHSVAEIDGFIPSRFYTQIKNSLDSPEFENELIENAVDFDDLLELSPLRANILRAFDWKLQRKILEIGCGSGLITSFLSSKNLQIDAITPSRASAQLAVLRTGENESSRIIAESFASLDFESTRYDVIILCGDTALQDCLSAYREMDIEQAMDAVLNDCKALLSKQGQLYLAVDNRYGVNFLFAASDQSRSNAYTKFNASHMECSDRYINLSGWRQLLSGRFGQVTEYYLFPDIYFSRVLLARDFIDSNANAYQHLDSMHSKSYIQSIKPLINESLLYQIANKNGYIGDVANGYLFVMTDDTDPQAGQLDFAHLPDFRRRPEFISVVLKKTREDRIERLKAVDKHDSPDADIKQTFESELYYSGSQLSFLWRDSFLIDPRGVKFEQYLLVYFSFLKKLDAGVIPGMNIDAIANNIIVDVNDEYHLIDREWQTSSDKIKRDFVFYRAMVHFALRNASVFKNFKWMNGLASLGDFLIYCFKTIGINLNVAELETFRERDCLFLSEVMLESKGYQLYDPFGVDIELNAAVTFVSWRYYNDNYHPHQKLMCSASVDNEIQTLGFSLSAVDRAIECIRFFPFEHLQALGANCFSIESLHARIINTDDSQHDLLHLDSSDEVNQANIHKGLFYGVKDDQHVFMFNNHDTFLEFNLPYYDFHEAATVQIEIEFRLSASHDYQIARYQYALAQRAIDTISQIKNHEIVSLKDDLAEITQEYHEVKDSRVWRLLMAYRDSFKISGYPRKNLLEKLRHMIRLFRYPR